MLQPRPALEKIKPYEPGKPVEEVERELGIKDALKLASNENPLGPSPLALQALATALPRVSFYPDGACFNLRRALARHLEVEEDQLIIGNGSDELLKIIAETFLNPGEEAIICPPTFSEYAFVTQLLGGECRYIPCREDFSYDLDAVVGATTPRTRLIFLANPNNPTGTIFTAAELEGLLEKLPGDVLLVLDEAYYEYVGSQHYPDSLAHVRQGRANLIVLRTFSKIYGLAGLRVGYGIGQESLIRQLHRAREPFNVNLLGQVAAVAALEDSAHLAGSRATNRQGKDYLYQSFTEIGLTFTPTEANFIWVQVPGSSREIFHQLLWQGVIVRTGDIFGYDDHLRITIGTPEQNARLVEVLKTVLHCK